MGRRPSDEQPEPFRRALAALRGQRLRPEITLEEVPGPRRIAPCAAAFTADVVVDGEEMGSGRFVLLHDPAAPAAWRGAFRVVTYARAAMEPEVGADPLLGQVGWSWLTDALQACSAEAGELGGTVTRVISESHGSLAARPPFVDLEIRASWTPPGPDDLGAHLRAWATLLGSLAGLRPLPDGVSVLPVRRP